MLRRWWSRWRRRVREIWCSIKSSLKHVCEKSTPSSTQMASQLAATRAALAEERQRREHLEESLQKLRRRTSRFGSTSSEPGSIADIISAHDVVIAYAEELAQRLATQLDLEGKDYLIEKLRKAHVTDDSAPVEGWLEVSPSLGSREAWREMYITLSSRRLLFFLSTEDYVRHKPCLVIQLDKIITVRNVESDTRGSTKGVRTTSANEQCCIQVSYATEGETKAISTFGETRDPEKLLRIFLDYKESQRTSKILYFRARTCRDKVQWLKRLKARLASCPYTGNAGMAGGALLHCLHNLKGFSSTGD